MKISLPRQPAFIWLAVFGLLLLVVLVVLGTLATSKYLQYSHRLQEIEPRYARIAGMLQNRDLFAHANEEVADLLAEYIYPSDQESGAIANTALQNVRELASSRGLQVTSSQTLSPKEDAGFERIGLNLRVEGQWKDMADMLASLGQQNPGVYLDSLRMGPLRGGADEAPQIFAQMDLYVLQQKTAPEALP